MATSLVDRTIIITGAGSGIGAATALACADAGMDVVLNGRRLDRLEEVAAAVRARSRRASVVGGDVTDPGVTAAMLDVAAAEHGGFHAVFANAGYGFERSVVEMPADELRRIFDVNFFATVDLLRAAARRLLDDKRPGHLLVCSSSVSRFSMPGYAAYTATKSAQQHVAHAMRMELRGHGVRVSSVHPVTTTSEFFDVSARLTTGDPDASAGGPPDHAPKMFVQTPERVAGAVVRCLRRPRPEVWTSGIVRGFAAASGLFPRLADSMLKKKR